MRGVSTQHFCLPFLTASAGRFRRAEAELAGKPRRIFKLRCLLRQQSICEHHERIQPCASVSHLSLLQGHRVYPGKLRSCHN
jgi:hypothetical protein